MSLGLWAPLSSTLATDGRDEAAGTTDGSVQRYRRLGTLCPVPRHSFDEELGRRRALAVTCSHYFVR